MYVAVIISSHADKHVSPKMLSECTDEQSCISSVSYFPQC